MPTSGWEILESRENMKTACLFSSRTLLRCWRRSTGGWIDDGKKDNLMSKRVSKLRLWVERRYGVPEPTESEECILLMCLRSRERFCVLFVFVSVA